MGVKDEYEIQTKDDRPIERVPDYDLDEDQMELLKHVNLDYRYTVFLEH